MIAKWLIPFMNNIIYESESAFVPGRLITDNVLVAYEINHHLGHKHWGTVGSVALKVDLSTTYDLGFRQGDTLSPYLLLFYAEAFSNLLQRAEMRGEIRGVAISRQSPLVSHLLFAYDILVFCQAMNDVLRSIRQVLGWLEATL
ncbi:UNVERIFIED_CONTAM: hypothetical protein Sindi_0977100 [Sesamum indicum]